MDAAAGALTRRVVTVTEQGPTTTETHAEARSAESADRKLDLTVTPAPRPGWAVQVGVEDVISARQARVELRRRLFGPFWAAVSAVPARQTVGVGLGVEW